MKTPDQIARETVRSEWGLPEDTYPTTESVIEAVMDARDERTAEDIIDTIRVAIEADRAQRLPFDPQAMKNAYWLIGEPTQYERQAYAVLMDIAGQA